MGNAMTMHIPDNNNIALHIIILIEYLSNYLIWLKFA